MDNLMNQFKRDSKSHFRSGYTIKNPTHLVKVVQSLERFPAIITQLDTIKYEKRSVENIEKVKKIIKPKQVSLLDKIIYLEIRDKQKLIDIIYTCIINNTNIDKELEQLIKSKEQALDYATALGIIDDYIEYLESGVYNGPTTKI